METNETQVVAETTVETSEAATTNIGEAPATETAAMIEATATKETMMFEPHFLSSIFPPLNEKELQQLTSDIMANGQQQPLVITEDGKLLDGRGRQEAIRRAGRTPQIVCLTKETDPLKYVISANLHRRQLSDDQRCMVAVSIAQQLAKLNKTERAKKAAAVRHGKVAKGLTADPKERAATAAAKLFNLSPAKIKLGTRLSTESPAAALAVKNGTISFKQANREVWAAKKVAKIEEAAAAFMAENTGDFDKACQLYHTDFRNLSAIRPDLRENVDWIITDIPYEFKDLHLVPELGKVAAEILKPGGHLVIMTGSAALPTVINGILTTPELGWRWMIASVMKGGPVATMRGIYNANQSFKSILVFRKIGSDVPPSIIKKDVIDAGEMTDLKEIHPHTQSIGNFVNIMDTLDVRPNSLVVDPFCGLGTTGAASILRNCKFVACDIEKKYIEFSKKRLMAEWSALHPSVVVAEALKEAA